MTRRCNGEDPNLIREVNPNDLSMDDKRASKLTKTYDGKCFLPCDCGLVFDDVRRSTVYPHERV